MSDWRKEKRAETHISLNQTTRLSEKEADDLWRLELDNTLLVANGENPVKSLKELEELKSRREAEKVSESSEDPDPLIVETGHILKDYINLSGVNRHTAQASN